VFEQRIENKNNMWKQNTHQSRMTSYPKDADLRNGSHREGERENTPEK
jgi:hypothetical protein